MLRAIDHFEIKEALQDERDLQRTKWFIAARDDRDKKAKLEERMDDDFMELASSVILATQMEVQEFQARLDVYDEATVKALMENTQALEDVNERISEKLDQAHVLEDGRKVFKSEDGTWAVDENGSRLDSTINNMEAIPKTKVTAEEFETDTKERDQLLFERQKIIEYQEKLDHSRERSDSKDFSKEELDGLDQELEAEMPMAVKRQMPGYDPAQETRLNSDFSTSARPVIEAVADVTLNSTMMPTIN